MLRHPSQTAFLLSPSGDLEVKVVRDFPLQEIPVKLQTIPVKYQEILEKKSGDPDQISGNLGKILGNLCHIIDPINYVMLFSSFPLTKEMR